MAEWRSLSLPKPSSFSVPKILPKAETSSLKNNVLYVFNHFPKIPMVHNDLLEETNIEKLDLIDEIF